MQQQISPQPIEKKKKKKSHTKGCLVHALKNMCFVVWKYVWKYVWVKKYIKIRIMLFKNKRFFFLNNVPNTPKSLAISIFSRSFLVAVFSNFQFQTLRSLLVQCVVEMATNWWLRPEVRSDPQLLFHNTFIVLTKISIYQSLIWFSVYAFSFCN